MEKIAIVGMGCRFPGAPNPEAYWQLLSQGGDAISEIPADRWNVDRYFDPSPQQPGKMNTRWGGFIAQVDRFDAAFFGITPKEAERMDPQHRLVLEVAWECLEDAGLSMEAISGTTTGVFLGIGNYDYGRQLINNPELINAYDGIGNTLCIAANRLSYFLNLRGPSLVLESACSSSLVSLHYALRSLQLGESDRCLVGGVSLMLSPEPTITYSHAKMMSSDGHCKTFDASANGYVRGEGCGIVLLRRLSDAIADGDTILAVISGSAVNQDGRSSGLTAPNGPAQEAVIRQALGASGLRPEQISYVEAHGTGTPLGDPIEFEALQKVYSQGRIDANPCSVGSVKTNIGHLEAAAGIAGLIKLVLMLRHRQIPAHLHLRELNPYIQLRDTAFRIPTQLESWLPAQDKLYAGLSSFGFGGTNAHVIVEEAPVTPAGPSTEASQSHDTAELLVLSARSEPALRELCDAYRRQLEHTEGLCLTDLCGSAATGRSHFNHRFAAVARSVDELRSHLDAFTKQVPSPAICAGVTPRNPKRKLAFLMTGQGSQYPGMGADLYATEPVFRAEIDRCDAILQPLLGQSLCALLFSSEHSESLLQQTAYTQPALFALEYALARLWLSWGVKPTLLIGHSLGEYVAAALADVFSLEDALRLIARRGQLIQSLPQDGSMVAVFHDHASTLALLHGREKEVALATINGTSNCVISGRRDAIEEIVACLTDAGIATKPLAVSHAFHSPLMDEIADAFAEVADSIAYHTPTLPILSNLNGRIAGDEIATAAYWCRHLREPVQFLSALEHLVDQNFGLVLEIGPRPTLAALAASLFADRGRSVTALPSLHPKRPDREQMLDSVGRLQILGVSLRWEHIYPPASFQRIPLPTYPFQRQRFWLPLADAADGVAATPLGRKSPTPLLTLLERGNSAAVGAYLAGLPGLTADQASVLPLLAEALVQEHQSSVLATELASDSYELRWLQSSGPLAPRSQPTPSQPPQPGRWWVLADRQGIGAGVAERLRRHGADVLVIEEADSTSRPWLDPAALQSLSPDAPLQVVHLWGLDAQQDDVQHCLKVPLELNRALAACASAGDARFWFITQQATGLHQDSRINPAQAALWGFAKVLGLEEPEHLRGIVDLPASTTDDILDRLVGLLLQPPREPFLALRGDVIYLPRLERSPMEPRPCPRLSGDHSYLVTGGLGALGLQVAEWLADRGAGALVLLSRRAPSPEVASRLAALESAGVSVRSVQADVTDAEALREVWSDLSEDPRPLAGVFHCAGLTSYAEIKDLDWSEAERILSSKVRGGWLLHCLTKDQPLDHFVCFSSIASVWGSRGQAHYAAANAFLDGLCAERHRQGLAATCINWGPWQGGGMASDEFRELLGRMGVRPLDPAQALAAMGQVLAEGQSHCTIATIDWQKFRPLYELKATTGLLSELGAGSDPMAASPSSADGSAPQAEAAAWLRKLQALPEHSRSEAVLSFLRGELATVLGFTESTALPHQANLFDLGIDSLMAMDILELIRSKLNAEISFLELVQNPTLQGISESILHQLLPEEHGAVSAEDVVCLEDEAVLDASIVPPRREQMPSASGPLTLLLTGASGFLGAYLLHDLLQSGEQVIYCLVRPSKDQSGLQRIIANLRRYGLWQESMAQRIIPIQGDLAKPQLGLEEEDYLTLGQQVDVIYHSAAVLNFVYPYSTLKPINVLGTQEVIRLACTSRLKHLHYVSTDAVFDSSEYYDRSVCEQDSILATQGIDLGYTQTKWVSERLVSLAGERGVPVTIYRPPLITGDSRTGKWNTDDFTCLFLKGCVQMGRIPDIHADVTFVPVDYVSKAIVALSRSDAVDGNVYHLTNPHSTSWHQVARWIDALGFPLVCVPYEQWERQLLSDSTTGSNVLAPLLPFFQKRWSAEQLTFAQLAERRVRLDSQQTAQALADHHVTCPVIDKQLIATYFAYFTRIDFVHASAKPDDSQS